MRAAPLLVGVAAALAVACADTTTPPVATEGTPADSADQFMIGMTARLTDGGMLRAVVLADTALFFDDHTRLEMFGVSARFFTSTGAENGYLTALRGTYSTRTGGMEGFGDVVLVSVDGRRLRTQHLRYNKALNLVETDSAFVGEGPDGTTEGIGFTTDPGMNQLRIHRLIRGSARSIMLPGR